MTPSLLPARPTHIFEEYWKFAFERHRIFLRQVQSQPHPWTNDPVLQKYKFTNAFRAADRVTQYLIRNVIYFGDQSADEVIFRILLFKIFNKIETWETLSSHFGSLRYSTFDVERYDRVLTERIEAGTRIYSAAYIMPSPSQFGCRRKHSNHLRLIASTMEDDFAARAKKTSSLRDLFELLKGIPSFGDFLAYQLAIDINYSNVTDHSEMEFVVAGPGARSGIRKCFSDMGGLTESELIRIVTEQQEFHFDRLNLSFSGLFGRRLQLIDCQNLFCEIDKYSRVTFPDHQGVGSRTRIKQKYRESAKRFRPWFPPKWGINDKVATSRSEYPVLSISQQVPMF